VKCGVIADAGLFETLERSADRVLRRDLDLLVRLIEACVRIKVRVVVTDPRETGRRKILNFGHTIGHALETLARYRMAHGEAVAIGMVAEARIAARAGLAPAALADRIASLLAVLGLPTSVPRASGPPRSSRSRAATRRRVWGGSPTRCRSVWCHGARRREYGLAVEDAEVASVLRSR